MNKWNELHLKALRTLTELANVAHEMQREVEATQGLHGTPAHKARLTAVRLTNMADNLEIMENPAKN